VNRIERARVTFEGGAAGTRRASALARPALDGAADAAPGGRIRHLRVEVQARPGATDQELAAAIRRAVRAAVRRRALGDGA
jgi:hypothetical protein